MIDRLYQVICERRDTLQSDSYVASLITRGPDAILKKIGEEATEVIIAGKNLTNDQGSKANPTATTALIHEIADLTFHTLVLMAEQKIPPEAVTAELESRFGTSGLTEKLNR